MNRCLMGLLASLACLLFLSAALVAMISVMYAVSYTPVHLLKLALVPVLAAGGWLMLRWLDRKMDN